MEYKGLEKINGLMYRYILPLNKKARKTLNKYPDLEYPKDEDLAFYKRVDKGKFVEIEKPNFDMNVFEYNYQKY